MKKVGALSAALLLVFLSACTPRPASTPVPTSTPTPTPTPTPDPYSNSYAQADVSRLEDGLVRVRYTGPAQVQIKAQLTKAEGTDYNYDLPNDGAWIPLTLTEGEGEYSLRVLENVEGDLYRPVFQCTLALELADPLSPFRQANQYVSFTADSPLSALARDLTGGLETEEEKAGAIFAYVTEHLSYDEEKAAEVEPGYLPDPEAVLREGKGICFDYAAVMAAMLRSQGVACRLAVGYAGKVYHAWVETPQEEGWRLWDPTFLSANRGDQTVLDFVSQPENYAARLYY